MKLSVVIPTLNRLESLKVTLNNLIPQIQRNLLSVELQVSVNSSNDATEEYIKELVAQFSFVKYKCFQERVDICESFSRSIDLCRGEYVIIFGDDDIPAPYMVETILEVLKNNPDAQLFHFNRVVGSNLNPQSMNRLRIEGKEYLAGNENLEIGAFIEKYTISPGFISAMVFKRDAWHAGSYLGTSTHYGYEFLSTIYAGIHKLGIKKCIYHSHPLVVQRLVSVREWNSQWPKFWLLGVPNLLMCMDEEGISKNAINVWHQHLNDSWTKFIYALIWASAHKKIYRALIPDIAKHQKSLSRKVSVFLIISFMPNFMYRTIRRALYR